MLAMAVASFAVGAVVRVFAAQNDLWFDEVWTLELLCERVHSFGDLYVRYFMISVATSLVLLPSGYKALLRRGLAGLGVALALLAIFVAETPPRLLIYFDLVAASTSPLSISWK